VIVLPSLLRQVIISCKLKDLGCGQSQAEDSGAGVEGTEAVLLLHILDNLEDRGGDRDRGLALLQQTHCPHGVHEQYGGDIEDGAVEVVLLKVDLGGVQRRRGHTGMR